MQDTHLYVNPEANSFHFYRIFDNGGSLDSGYPSLELMITAMKESRKLNAVVYNPINEIPDKTHEQWGNIDTSILEPLASLDYVAVRAALGIDPGT